MIFVKAPRPGQVKTRLAAALGDRAAAEAYVTLVNRLVCELKPLQNVHICFTPDDAFDEVQQWLQPGWSAKSQGTGNLGDRLSAAFTGAFADGADRVVVIGSDCPSVQPSDIESAWNRLESTDLILGPATDGGYWLVGLRQFHRDLFTGIPWSTGAVLTDTLQRASELGLSTALLRTLSDIDTAEDWFRFVHPPG